MRKKTEFKPLEDKKLKLYVCGVTVYDYCHIGHARVSVFFDTLVRTFEHLGYSVDYVRNVTDIDDKIIKRAAEQSIDESTLTQRFEQAMLEDFSRLNIRAPNQEPKATEYMTQMLDLIQVLVDKNIAYQAASQDVLYRVNAFADYGKLSNQSLEDLVAGARVQSDDSKENPLDFVLWKQAKEGEPSWDSPWGKGRPGWHLECSAMATNCLGSTIDIHGGGHDLLFPHHENEIAQSEAATCKPFANNWLHVGFVNIDNEKMSKSLGNFFTIREVLDKYPAEVVRLFLISSHYRSPVNYSTSALDDATKALMRLAGPLKELPDCKAVNHPLGDYAKRFFEALEDDFNTPIALSVLYDLVTEINKSTAQVVEKCELLRYLSGVLGLLIQPVKTLFQGSGDVDEAWIEDMIQRRNAARHNKNWAEADKLRDEISAAGIVLEDAGGKTTWRKG